MNICWFGLDGFSRISRYSFLRIISDIWSKEIFLSNCNFWFFSSSQITISIAPFWIALTYTLYIHLILYCQVFFGYNPFIYGKPVQISTPNNRALFSVPPCEVSSAYSRNSEARCHFAGPSPCRRFAYRCISLRSLRLVTFSLIFNSDVFPSIVNQSWYLDSA